MALLVTCCSINTCGINVDLNGGVWVISGYFRMIGAKPAAWIYLLILLNLLISLKVKGFDVPLTLVQDAVAKGAVCLDGSPPAYHFAPGFGSGTNNWLVHMESAEERGLCYPRDKLLNVKDDFFISKAKGGGWCSNVEECKERTENFRGSSKYMEQISFSGILGNKQNLSPDFYNWNKVKIRYCDGSSFTGDIEAVNPATNLYFRGARVWRAIMDELLAKGMNKAQNALLSGCSAGGLASILHCDSFRDLLPAGASVKCFSDAGYFIDAKDVSGKESIKDFYSQVVTTHGSAKNLPSSCTSRFPPSMCFFPQYVVQSMRTPLFILNAAYDAWQIKNILAPSPSDPSKVWGECKLDIKKCSSSQLQVLQDFRSEFLRALPANSPSIGMFIDSCYSHCQSGAQETWLSSNSPAIDSMSIAKAVGDWFFGRSAVQKIDCPYPCNPTCHNREID